MRERGTATDENRNGNTLLKNIWADEKTFKRVFSEIKSQMLKDSHPFQILNNAFHKSFSKEYKRFVVKPKIARNSVQLMTD
jgi:hypothetical protein